MTYTKEERQMILNYAKLVTGKKSGKQFKMVASQTSVRIKELMQLFGEKPKDMPADLNRVEYWLAHLDL